MPLDTCDCGFEIIMNVTVKGFHDINDNINNNDDLLHTIFEMQF